MMIGPDYGKLILFFLVVVLGLFTALQLVLGSWCLKVLLRLAVPRDSASSPPGLSVLKAAGCVFLRLVILLPVYFLTFAGLTKFVGEYGGFFYFLASWLAGIAVGLIPFGFTLGKLAKIKLATAVKIGIYYPVVDVLCIVGVVVVLTIVSYAGQLTSP